MEDTEIWLKLEEMFSEIKEEEKVCNEYKIIEFKSLKEFYEWIKDKDVNTKLKAKKYFELYGSLYIPVVIIGCDVEFVHPKNFYNHG